ncbi:MAG: N-acetylglucosamine-6-phosphate deacetylase [Clostridia bacterium]|nr:N-acetylglucosamine-6-phosphate deacetylase [Clostridia bacterium]
MKAVIKNAYFDRSLVDIVVNDGVISDILPHSELLSPEGAEIFDVGGKDIFPGLFDIHAHGCLSFDTTEGNGRNEMCRYLAKSGTTSWLPTTMTASRSTLTRAVNELDFPQNGCDIVGIHLEGPFVSPKAAGAQDPDAIRLPDIEEFRSYKNVKMITVAPELEGAMEFIENCGISVALGHTVCDYDTACEAFDRGANCLTHTFNAMPPLHHRTPGPIGAAIDKNAYVQVITDGFHLHGSVVKMLYRTFGPDRMVIISDSVAPAGLPDGEYMILSRPHVIKNSHAFLPDGTIAGSSSTLMDCVRTAISFGIPKADALRMASETPANCIGVKKGRIAVGYDADFIILDSELNVLDTFVKGHLIK